MIKLSRGRFRILLAIAILAALVALPAFSSHTCVAGTDNYNQCVAQTAGDEPVDVGSEPEDPWYLSECEDDACR